MVYVPADDGESIVGLKAQLYRSADLCADIIVAAQIIETSEWPALVLVRTRRELWNRQCINRGRFQEEGGERKESERIVVDAKTPRMRVGIAK